MTSPFEAFRERNELYSHRIDAFRYMLTPQEARVRFHNVQIQILDNGAVLMQVGCKSLGFTDYQAALLELTRYYQNPKGVEAEYAAKYGWPSVENQLIRSFDGPTPEAPIATAVGMGIGGIGGIR